MAVVIDSANIASTTSTFSNNASFSCTTSSDNYLLVGAAYDLPPGIGPFSATYAGVPMTPLGTVVNGGSGNKSIALFGLFSPAAGANTVFISIGNTGNMTAGGFFAIPFSGVNSPSTVGTGSGTTGTAVSSSASGGTANDVYIGVSVAGVTTQTGAGGSQTNLIALTSINGLESVYVDTISGANPGSFSWTITSSSWASIAIPILAPFTTSVAWWKA